MSYFNPTPYPSVTTILRPYIDATWFTDEARGRGSAVHEACAAYLMGTFRPPLAPEHQPYFDSARRWINMAVDKVLLCEERLVDPVLRYCGKPDLICTLRGEPEAVLIDFKTSQAEYPAWKLQVAAYRKLAAGEKKIFTVRGLSVRLKSDGSGCLVKEYPANYERAFNIFQSLLNAHHYFYPTGGKP